MHEISSGGSIQHHQAFLGLTNICQVKRIVNARNQTSDRLRMVYSREFAIVGVEQSQCLSDFPLSDTVARARLSLLTMTR